MKNFTFCGGFSMCRSMFVAAFVGISLATSAQTMQVLNSITDADGTTYSLMSQAISPNHKYVAGRAMNYEEMKYGVFVYDVEAGNYYFQGDVDMMGSDLRAVTDAGIAVGYNGSPETLSIDGTSTPLSLPEGYMARPQGVGADANVIVGSYYSEMDFISHACVWRDGELEQLPEPGAEEAGIEVTGSEAYYTSADGSVIAGTLLDVYGMGVFVLWNQQSDGTYVCDLVYKDYFSADGSDTERPYNYFMPAGLSQNGKYAALKVGIPELEQRMARYDIETGELEVYVADGSGDIPESASIESSGISDNGTVIGNCFTGMVQMQTINPCIWKNGEDAPQLISKMCPDLTDFVAFDDMGGNFILGITPDGRYLTGYAYDTGKGGSGLVFDYTSYVVDLEDLATGIKSAVTSTADGDGIEYYTIDGVRVNTPAKGLNIVRKADGSTVKVVIK